MCSVKLMDMYDPNPVYLGITLDRSLMLCDHLGKTAAKVGTRNNLVSTLAGSSWAASAPTLRTSALALCYSVAEYCTPVWSRSALTHIHLADTQLHETMHIISGTLHATPLLWLPVTSILLICDAKKPLLS